MELQELDYCRQCPEAEVVPKQLRLRRLIAQRDLKKGRDCGPFFWATGLFSLPSSGNIEPHTTLRVIFRQKLAIYQG